MDDVKIEVVGAEPLEGRRDLPLDGGAGQLPLVEVHLARQNDVFAGHAEVRQRGSDELLTGATRVHVGGVDEVDAQFECALDDRLGGGLVDGPLVRVGQHLPETHPTETQRGNHDVALAQLRAFHDDLLRS